MSRRRAARLLATAVVWLGPFGDPAVSEPIQGIDRSLQQFHHSAWTAREGAPSQISALAQTGDGYLWIGTARGVFRFDGLTFERYAPPDVQLPAQNVYSMRTARDGSLWIAFRPSGVAHVQLDGSVQVLSTPDQLPRSLLFDLCEDAEGRLWGATQEGLVERVGDRWRIADENEIPRSRVRNFLVARDHAFWVSTDDGVFRRAPGARTFDRLPIELQTAVAMTQASDGRIWIADYNGEAALHVVSSAPPFVEQRIPNQTRDIINAVVFDHDGAVWINMLDRGIVRLDAESLLTSSEPLLERLGMPYMARDGLTSEQRARLFVDREGDVWAGTDTGLDRFRQGDVVPVSMPQPSGNFTLLRGEHDDLWVGSTSTTVFHVTAQERTGRRMASSEPVMVHGRQVRPRSVSSAFDDGDGTAFWGDGAGVVWKQTGPRFAPVAHVSPDHAWDIVWDITRGGPSDALWISFGDDPIAAIEQDRIVPLARPEGMLARGASASWHEGPGRTWIGHTENRVQHIVGANVVTYGEADGVDIGRIRVIRGDGERVWFGGELGLAFFDGHRFHRVAIDDPLALGTVSGLVVASSGDVWLAELNGIVRLPVDEVGRLANDPAHLAKVRRFDFLDGLRGALQMNWTSSVAIESTDHRLWFATDNGLATIDPTRLQPSSPAPPVVIRSLFADDVRRQARQASVLPVGTRGVRVDFTALTLAIPERTRFRYMLDGFETAWHATSVDNRIASYTRVPAGHYRFRVQTADGAGRFVEPGASLDFDIAAAFWETRSFAILCGAMVVALAVVVYRLRMQQVRSRVIARLQIRRAERERIARDLHDTLLQGLQGLILKIHTLVHELPPDVPARAGLDEALDEAEAVMIESRDRVGDLRTNEPSDLEGTFRRLKGLVGLPSVAEVDVFSTGRYRELDARVADQVRNIGREAIINALRHSQAELIRVEIHYSADRFRLTVSDDGIGIERSAAVEGAQGHYGVPGMRERAATIQAVFGLDQLATGGTRMTLELKARDAYEREPNSRA